MSSRNPFRRENGLLSPQATGQTAISTAAPSFQSQDPDPPPSISEEHLPTISSSSERSETPALSVSQTQSDREALEAEPDDLPPPYTPGPAASEGETTIDFGPVRPFQQAPHHASYTVTPQATGSGRFLPPPRHPSITRHSTGNMSQDFIPMPPGSFSPAPSRYAPPSTPAPSRGYAPPSGTPPTMPPSASRYAPPSTPRPSTPAQRPPTNTTNTAQSEDDGRPTTSPTPGHPLLRNNRVLIYPKGHTCWKCDNTGFKSYDPTHPCRKCWERYSKPFEGPIVYAPWTPSSRSTSSNADTLQKPLPRFRPPAGNLSTSPILSRAPNSHWNPPPPPLHHQSSSMSRTPSIVTHRPPPGSLVVLPGDPRIGGRLCWRCDGLGTVSFLIFDEETCPVCNGAGRIFH